MRSSVVQLHAGQAVRHVNQFAIFINKNALMPFFMKKHRFGCSLMSAILYSSETWLCKNLKCVSTLYMTTIKSLLSVIFTTINILCLLEAGYPELEAVITKRRVNFITKFMRITSLVMRPSLMC